MITRGNYSTLGMSELLENKGYRLLGYSWLCNRYGIDPLEKISCHAIAKDIYEYNFKNDNPYVNLTRPGSYFDQEYASLDTISHIMYAVSGELFNPYILKKVFSSLGRDDKRTMEEMINESPDNAVNRKVGYMYEKFTGNELDFVPSDTMASGKRAYEKLLSPSIYYTLETRSLPESRVNQKYRIYDNTLGDLNIMCPIVRKTRKIDFLSARNYGQELVNVFKETEPEILENVKELMFFKESMMSFKVEGEGDASVRIKAYEKVLKDNREGLQNFNKKTLVDIQSQIVSQEKVTDGYRDRQNFVGSMRRGDSVPTINYVPPKPGDVEELMGGIMQMHSVLEGDSEMDPVVAGSVMHGAMVSVHPFEDGNGRLSRFCFHDMLASHNYVPGGAIFPISDIISQNKKEYIRGLEDVTYSITRLCKFDIDGQGYFSVKNNDIDLYRYLDMTPFVETMYEILKKTMDETVPEIIDGARMVSQIKSVIDNTVPSMNDKQKSKYLGVFLREEEGQLSYDMKRRVFSDISDEDLEQLQTKTKKIIHEFNRIKAERKIMSAGHMPQACEDICEHEL